MYFIWAGDKAMHVRIGNTGDIGKDGELTLVTSSTCVDVQGEAVRCGVKRGVCGRDVTAKPSIYVDVQIV